MEGRLPEETGKIFRRMTEYWELPSNPQCILTSVGKGKRLRLRCDIVGNPEGRVLTEGWPWPALESSIWGA